MSGKYLTVSARCDLGRAGGRTGAAARAVARRQLRLGGDGLGPDLEPSRRAAQRRPPASGCRRSRCTSRSATSRRRWCDRRLRRSPARLPGFRGAGRRQQHHRSRAMGVRGRTLRPARSALPLLPSRQMARLQGGRAELRPARDRADAEVVGVLDSDYMVSPDWLRCMVPCFADPSIGFVQSPQDYRDNDGSFFKRLMFWEYAGFFHLGMVTRNERNAIIQHGTMTLIRRTALEEAGGWAEWTITEDAELGLRLFRHGLESDLCRTQLRPRRDAGRFRRLPQAALPLGLRRHADQPSATGAPCSRLSTASLRAVSAGISSPAGCPGWATRSGLCSCSWAWSGPSD